MVQAVTGKSLLNLSWSWFTSLFKLRARKQTVTEYRGKKLRKIARAHV